MWWIALDEPTEKDEFLLEEGVPFFEEQKKNGIRFYSGEYISRDIELCTITIPEEESDVNFMPDNFLGMEINTFVFNQRVRKMLEACQVDNIQYFPVRIINKGTGEIFDDYKIANIIGIIDCIDYDKSNISWHSENSISFIKGMTIDPEKVKDAPLVFRIKGYPLVAAMHNSLKTALEENDISGINFVKPEKFFV